MPEAPSVFISYTHESAEHRDHVIEFAAFLHQQGIATVLDAWLEVERRDWYSWALRGITEADYVVVVASENYSSVSDGYGRNRHGSVRSGADVLREMIHEDRERWLHKILPVLLPGHENAEIPVFLQPYSANFFAVTEFTVQGAEELLRVIHRRPPYVAPPVAGQPPELPVLASVRAVRNAPDHGTARVPRQLPLAVRDFVGRKKPLAALDAATAVAAPGVVIVDGAAGVGKTAMTVYWAHTRQDQFPDGILFVNLRGHGPSAPLEPARALVSFLYSLGVAEERMPHGLDVLVGLYRSLVAGRRMLILLDDAASAGQVRPLLPGAPDCVTIVTSRAMMTGLVVGEAARRIALDLFTLREAILLVSEVVGAERVAAEPDSAADLARLCAKLPLAVRVAASRVAVNRHTTLADVVADIACPRARLDRLSGADDSTAVRVVLDWSCARLSAEQALVFRRLGLHPVPEFGVSAAAALTGLNPDRVRRNLEVLAEVHLLEHVGRGRYRFHCLLHVHANERAEAEDTSADRDRALAAMVTWYTQAAATADRLVFPGQPAAPGGSGAEITLTTRDEAWSWLVTECDVLLAALEYADDHDMAAAAVALGGAMRFLALRPSVLWGARLAAETRGLRAARAAADLAAEAALCGSRADTHQMMGHWAESDADLERLVVLAGELDEPAMRAEALCGMGRNRKLQHRYAEAQWYYQQALPLTRDCGGGRVEAVVECNLGQLSARLGRPGDALGHAERELALRQECGDVMGEAYALHNMVIAEQGLGDHHTAIALGHRAQLLYRATAATERFLADVLETTAISLDCTGDRETARRCLREAARIRDEHGDPRADFLSKREDDTALAAVFRERQPPAATETVL
ncbi:SEFIR domain-containing protein [Amycolatopsis sp. NPDC026612]|uniref:SEFIR domain-containing protein n=1 Tax=Amycolatopsis sp. NPDC026612 TaxID=3155466 RepID=UPI0034066758